MRQFWKLTKTEFKRIFTNRVLVLIFFGAPLLYGLVFILVYKKGKITDMPVVVIDGDRSALSTKFIDAINDNENLEVAKVQFDDNNIAREMPSKEYIAVISIPENFSSYIQQRRYPEIMVDINTVNLVTANFASRAIQTVLGTLSAGIEIESLKKAGMDAPTAAMRFEPFKVNYVRFYNPAGNYLDLMMPGILGTIMQQVLLLAMGLVFARDFEDGYFKKLVRISKFSSYHLLLKLTPFIPLTAIVWLVTGSFFPAFHINMQVFTWPVAALVTLFSLACMFVGMLFSLAFTNQLRATEFLMVLATPSFLLSGYTWPLESMPPYIADFAQTLPLTHFLQGFRRLVMYKGSFTDIYPQIKALSIIITVTLVLTMVLLKLKIVVVHKKRLLHKQ